VGHSGKTRHRDREPSLRHFDAIDPPSANRVFRIADAEREQIAECLRYIDEARRALESQQNPDNRDIIRELKASADRIYDLINELEETDC
jgi:cell division septum initiation protein DivIVA